MNLFCMFPTIEKCCYCISLKIGSIIIVVLHLIFVVEVFLGVGGNKGFAECYSSGIVMRILGYLAIFIAIALLCTAIYFLYGVIRSKPQAILFFMYASLALLLFNIVVSVVMFLLPSKPKCDPPYILGGATLISSIFLLYCLTVLVSFYREMDEEES